MNLDSIDNNVFCNFKPLSKFIFDESIKEDAIKLIKNLNLEKQIIKDADKICAHIFNLLGSGDKYLGRSINWSEDFKTCFVWENDYYKNIKIVDLSNKSDVKMPWELSRFQHIFTLGKAYWLTKDEKYALEFKEEIEDWINKNPYEHSVNWFCAMDVAIRAVNWIIGYYFFREAFTIDKEFWVKFNKVLYLHGSFIMNNLENKGLTSNHYLSDLAGLIFLGLYFKDFEFEISKDSNSKIWLEYGLKELESEMFIQVNEDGVCYEDSTSYHRLDSELFLIPAILCKLNHIEFSKKFNERLEKMFEFILDMTKPNGKVPFFGDADDGRLVIFSNYSNWNRKDFRHILAVAGEYFNRDDFRYMGKDYLEDALWAAGTYKYIENYNVTLGSKAYNQGGFYILRNSRAFCMIGTGELSFRGIGCHSHNDQFSFELNIDGEDFIVDPGVYVYTADGEMRNYYRKTEVHNTLCIEGYEQNNFTPELFELKEESFGKCEEFEENSFKGSHVGYKEKCGVIHERIMKLKENEVSIEDILHGELKKGLKASINFTLSEDAEVKLQDGNIKIAKNSRLTIIPEQYEDIQIVNGYISNAYGIIKNTKRVVVHFKENINKNVIRLIF